MARRLCRSSCRLIAIVTIVAAATAVPAPAAAICQYLEGAPPFEPGNVVFVGEAAATGASGQNALFHIEEIWFGRALPEWQSVIGSDDQNPSNWGDPIPSFEVGTRYFVVARRDGPTLRSEMCSATRPYGVSAAALRPAEVTAPEATKRPLGWAGSGAIHPLGPTLVGAALVLLLGWLLFTRRPGMRMPSPQ